MEMYVEAMNALAVIERIHFSMTHLSIELLNFVGVIVTTINHERQDPIEKK